MKQIIVDKPGGYTALVIRSRDEVPDPGPQECLIAVKYIGVNYADIIIREGYYTAAKGKYPLVPGFEYSGVVERVGENVSDFSIGDEVVGFTLFGGYSTHIVAAKSTIRPIPKGWSLAEAAGLLVNHLTAYHGLMNVGHVRSGETVLVHSAAGGVGSALLQQAKHLGAKTIAVVGSEKKKELAEHFGADDTVIKSPDMWTKIDAISPSGLDLIFDANGLTTPRPGYDRLRLGGRLVIYGFAELFPRGSRPSLPMLVYRYLRMPKFGIRKLTSTNRAIMGLNIAFLVDRSDLYESALEFILTSAGANVIQKPVLKTFGFSEVAQAHRHLESGESVGKTVLQVE